MKLGDISVAYVELMVRAAEQLGADAAPLLAQYQLDQVRLASADARISIPRFMRLGHDLIEQCQAPQLGLVMGQLTSASHLGLAGLLAQSASDVRTACRCLTEYELLSSFNSRGRSQFSLEQGQGIAHFYSISPYNAFNLFVVDSVLAGWAAMLHWLTGRNDLIARVEVEFSRPAYGDFYKQAFPAEVVFDAPRNAVVLHDWALSLPSLHRCASTYEGLKRLADRELQRVRLGLSFREQVERAIGPLLNGQTPTLEAVSQRLNMAPWTVRRRLSSEDTNFQQVLNDTRRNLAMSYVRDTSLTLGEIAYLLGFGSAAAFQRAFKRWSGIAPGRFREQCRLHISTASSPSSG
ncbi:AraC family transcriptional regulator [Bacterioplanes sanyensis]|uniref:AraC family transcriptional regulator n=2 Tax=Bacterioplanes sanyensis TaxID=1249553 RepID=A0A222FPP9_9GAMM|nr:AraC family transcriptional regulator [Bacterioplanes sanyensis]